MRYAAVALIGVVLVSEGAARLAGLGTALLYEKTEYGYRVVPGQTMTRLGRAIRYNDWGLRNEPVAALPAANTLRVLCVGDSITFGGTLTDQADTYPYQLQKVLSASASSTRRIEVLNASAGGWALENAAGWLARHGTLGARQLVLQVATHDLFQPRSSADIVGAHPSFPDRQPALALGELFSRYLLPRLTRWPRDPGVVLDARSAGDVERVLMVIGRIHAMAADANTTLMVLFVEQPHGVEPADELTLWAKQRFREFIATRGIILIETAALVQQAGGARLFRDEIHPNEEGNRVLAQAVAGALQQAFMAPPLPGAGQRPTTSSIESDGGARNARN